MAADDSPERTMIQLACSGNRDAQQSLWTAHRRWVAAIVLVHRPRSVDVDDLMQEVAIKFVSKIDTLRDPEAFRPWLRRIVINVCRGAARSLRPTHHLGEGNGWGGAAPSSDGGDGQLPGLVQTDLARRLLEQVMTLPSEYREPLLLRCVRSMSYQAISHTLGLPVTTVETRLARARRMLREEFGEPEQPRTKRRTGPAK